MRDARRGTGSGPMVCPFVALIEDRDRRADGPDPRNRCYASPAPRQRELAYQAEYCYSDRFSTCAAFLDWAARNAAEPSYPEPGIEASRRAEAAHATRGRAATAVPAAEPPAPAVGWAGPQVDRGDGAADGADGPGADPPSVGEEAADWIPAAAWAAFPTAPVEPDEPEPEVAETEPVEPDEPERPAERDEPTTAPKVPLALPLRRRRQPIEPIRTPGSGEWYYSDASAREPLVRRRFSLLPPVALGLIGLLVAALVLMLVGAAFSGGGSVADPSPSPGASTRPRPTPHPEATPAATVVATPRPSPKERTYRVKSGDALSAIAQRFGLRLEVLQCRNLIRNPDRISVGQVLTIPPEGYTCAPGWRRATPTPRPPDPEEAGASEAP